MLALQGELPVRLQLESQVGDGVRRWYPVPRVFQVGAEAQLQARDPLRGGHGALAGVELHAHHPQAPMILWGILRPKPHLRYRTGSETAQRI